MGKGYRRDGSWREKQEDAWRVRAREKERDLAQERRERLQEASAAPLQLSPIDTGAYLEFVRRVNEERSRRREEGPGEDEPGFGR